MQSSAVLSHDGCHRYELRRVWEPRAPLLVVCMLNPSTADHTKNDPTILTLIHFAKAWGYGGLLVINLYAMRSSSPAKMLAQANNRGPEILKYMDIAITKARDQGSPILVAWGNGGDCPAAYRNQFVAFTQRMSVKLVCLGTTMSGAPKHPMARGKHRIPRDQQPVAWP